jgi:hypothetical protein
MPEPSHWRYWRVEKGGNAGQTESQSVSTGGNEENGAGNDRFLKSRLSVFIGLGFFAGWSLHPGGACRGCFRNQDSEKPNAVKIPDSKPSIL